MSHINLAVVCIEHGCLEVDVAGLLIHAVDGGNIVVTLLYLADQLAFHIIEIKVHVAVAVAREQDVLLTHDAILHHLFLDELRHAFLDDLLALAGEWIHGVEAHIILVAVHRIDDETVGVWSGLDSRIVAVCIYRNIQCEGLARLHIVAPEAHLGVVLSCFRILVGILSRIIVELAAGRLGAFEELERIGLHVAFVETDPAE